MQLPRLAIAVCVGLALTAHPSAAQTGTPPGGVGADWTGTWYGTLTSHPAQPGAAVVDVRRDIGGIPSTDGHCTMWKTTYSENYISRQVKDYRLCRGTGADDLFIDEGNGMRATARRMDDVLVSMLTVDSALLVVMTRLRGEVLEEDILHVDHTLTVSGVQAFQAQGLQRLILTREPAWESPRTPSASGCDAWFGSRGQSKAGRHDTTFTLTNPSTSPSCVARRVTIWFQSPVAADAVRLRTPAGWSLTLLPCPGASTLCGWVWSHADGVKPSDSAGGFGIVYHQPTRLRIWQVDVGTRRVGLPYGYVGG